MPDSPPILHLTTHLGKGGAATNVLLSAIGVRERGHRVAIGHGPNESEETKLIQSAKELGVEFYSLPSLTREVRFGKDRRAVGEIRELIHRLRPNLIHTHQSKAGILGRWVAGRNSGIPVVHTPHGHVFYGYFPAWKTQLFIKAERVAAKWCDRLIGLTHREVKDHLDLRIGRPDQWRVVHSGVPLKVQKEKSASTSNPYETLGLGENSKVLLSVGRLEPVKGFADLLPHIASQFEADSSLYWVLLGEGSERGRIEETAARLGLEGRVLLPGWVENPSAWLARSEGLLVPSRNEGMGRVVVEAYSQGLPVFAASVGSLPELVPDDRHGVLFDWEHPDRIAEPFKAFLERCRDRSETEEVRRKTAEEYSVEKTIEKLMGCYEELLPTD